MEELDAHVGQPSGRTIRFWQRIRALHALVALAAAALWVVMLIEWRGKAWIAAAGLCAVLVVGVVLHVGYWRFTRAAQVADDPSLREQRVRRIGIRTMVHVGVSLVLCAVLVTTIVIEKQDFGLVAVVAFLALAMHGGPVWLAAVGDEESEERGRLDAEGARAGRRPWDG